MSKKLPAGVTQEPGGIWKIRTTAVDPRTGQIKVKKATLDPSVVLSDVVRKLEELKGAIRAGSVPMRTQQHLTVLSYAEDWIARQLPRLGSLLTRDRYKQALYNHILPDLGNIPIRNVDKIMLEKWLVKPRDKHAITNDFKGHTKRAPKPYSPETINGWWRILKEMMQDAVHDLRLSVDPTLRIDPMPAHVDPDALGDETINTLSAEEVVALLRECKRRYPQWFAFVFLGFAIGARPGELRPIRWGKDLDDSGKLTVRRSQHTKQLGPTKTKVARTFMLPPEVLTVLKEHQIFLKRNGHPAAEGELVFPRSGKRWRARVVCNYSRSKQLAHPEQPNFWSASALDRPLDIMAEKAGIKRAISPRVFRRTFNDIARKVSLNNLVTRALTGHSSIEMQERYSTVDLAEKAEGLAKVIELFKKETGTAAGTVDGLFGAIPDMPGPRRKKRSA